MEFIIHTIIFIIVIEHVSFFVLESFLWTKKRTVKIFGLKSLEFAKETKVLAANQGVYNLFLAIGLFVSHFEKDMFYTKLFLAFIIVAGIVGYATTKRITIFWIQALPAILAFVMMVL